MSVCICKDNISIFEKIENNKTPKNNQNSGKKKE